MYLNMFDQDQVIDIYREVVNAHDLTIEEAVKILSSEFEVLGYRERTIKDYNYHCERFSRITGVELINELNRDALIKYISHGEVKNATRRVRLKTIRSVFNKFYKKGWITEPFWNDIRIKVDEPVKTGTTESDLIKLITSLDFNDYIEYRDACIFILMWENGIRLNTLSQLEYDMIDFENNLITYESHIMKNHKELTLPISRELSKMLLDLHRWTIKKGLNSKRLFISTRDTNIPIHKSFSKRVKVYREKFNIYHINPHAIRRGFAKKLLDKDVPLPIISKALGHQTLATTTRYLHVDQEELIQALRDSEKQ